MAFRLGRKPLENVDIEIPSEFKVLGFEKITGMKPGDKVTGVIKAIDFIDSKKYKTKTNIYRIDDGVKTISINPGKGFDTLYGESMRVGMTVFIGYKGKRKGTDGNIYNDYAVALRGDENTVPDAISNPEIL